MTSATEVTQEISLLLRQLASPAEPGESVKACIRRASMRSGLSFIQAKKCWYGEYARIPAHIADQIRERAAEHDRRLKQSAFQTLLAMRESDPDLFRESIEALGDILHRPGQERRSSGGSR